MSSAPNPDQDEARRTDALGAGRGPGSGVSLSRAYDFPTRTPPTTFYVVASTPRSGSTYLCRRLWSTGMMGAPTEYFNYQGLMLQMVARLRPRNIFEYVRQLFAIRTSPNGVFGVKAHWSHLRFMREAEVMPMFPGLNFIYVERSDRLAQAVSYALARQTGRWVSHQDQRQAPSYDAALIRSCHAWIEHEIGQWQAMFRRSHVTPIGVAYESLLADPESVVDDILRRFGVARDPARRISLPPTEPMSSAVNEEWIERFRRESGDIGGGRDDPRS